MAETLYQCTNDGCSLGSRTEPGHFTGGMTAEQVNVLTGAPVESLTEGTDFGEGICPNCGKPGTEVGTHESVEGENAYTDVNPDEEPAVVS